jgi:hypothetical protein
MNVACSSRLVLGKQGASTRLEKALWYMYIYANSFTIPLSHPPSEDEMTHPERQPMPLKTRYPSTMI